MPPLTGKYCLSLLTTVHWHHQHHHHHAGKGEDIVQTLTMMADQRLYKLVKWCKSLPLFKNILIDDQVIILIIAVIWIFV